MTRKIIALSAALFISIAYLNASAQSTRRARRSAKQPSRANKVVTYTNPVFDRDFPDPTVIRASDGYYYAYATQSFVGERRVNMQVARSSDLVKWMHLGDALPVKPVWASETQKFWAPHISEHDGTFYMYYSAEPNTVKTNPQQGLCMAVATARSAAGPFRDKGEPLLCGDGFVNIDPMSFDDPRTGKRLLYWGSGFQPIKVQELTANRLSFLPGSQPVDLIRPVKTEDLSIYQRLVEGAWVSYRAPWYYLYYSGDNCCGEKAHYAVMVARSRSATGPFETFAEATGKAQSYILERKDYWIAPGHNSVVRDAGGHDWIFYHAIAPQQRRQNRTSAEDDVRRVMLMDRIIYRNGFPQIERERPTTTPQSKPITRTSRRK